MDKDQNTLIEISSEMKVLKFMQENNTKAISDLASSIKELVTSMKESDDLSKEALEKAKSAHKRLDKYDKVSIWLITLVGAALVGALLNLILKG